MIDQWWLRAACRGEPLSVFFKDGTQPDWSDARALCDKCPVVEECLKESLAEESHFFGFRGGMAPTMRKLRAASLRRKYGIPRPIDLVPINHGTYPGYRRCMDLAGGACAACRDAHAANRRVTRSSRAVAS